LSNGPTLAFKDMAMQLLGNLFEYTLQKQGTELNILGATSGDTGSAAEYAMRGKHGIKVFMLSPHRKMSAFQTAQMFSLQDPNIFNIAVDGVFDDCQDMVKAVSNDLDYKSHQKIGTVNSINWARVVVSFTVPSGNFGNICAGHIARMMGLPIKKLIVATNENDVLHEFFQTGIYRVRKSSETMHTSSPSMDISKASNFERFIYDLLQGDTDRVRQLFHKVEREGGFDLSGKPGSDGNEFIGSDRFGFLSGKSTHTDRIKTIQDAAARYQLTVDTYTADGIKVAREHIELGVPMIVLETALPAKFNETIREALGRDAERPAGFENIESLPQRFDVMAADAAEIKRYIAARTGL
jgi:threonine synthase